jgi:hypothetical protein
MVLNLTLLPALLEQFASTYAYINKVKTYCHTEQKTNTDASLPRSIRNRRLLFCAQHAQQAHSTLV